jgi:3-oxoacyl-[acyl-carrier protein] reductase
MVHETAYITGGSSGIGLAIARSLLERGWKVSICARDAAKLERAASQLEKMAPPSPESRVHAAPADVSSEAAVKRWIAGSSKSLGPPDLLVNNAGVGVWGGIASLTQEDWDEALDVNLKGAFLCTREVLPAMRAKGGGYIVNVSSISGKKGMAGGAAYCASKFGLIGLTESLLAEEKKNNIRATSLCPGYVATPMVGGVKVPSSEMIQPEDVAATVLYLLGLTSKVVIREIVIERIGA